VKGDVLCDKIYENDKIIAFLDIAPVNLGHTLVIPKLHFKDLFEIPEDVLFDLIIKTKKIAKSVMTAVNAEGINLGMNNKSAAGQAVFHAHMHIIPRFSQDGLKHWPNKKVNKADLEKTRDLIVKYLKYE